MNIIEKKLLSVTYPNIDIALLEEVINATPNPTIATEIMCGLYEYPAIPTVIWKDNIVRTFNSYDKWNDYVEYKYEQFKTIYEYYPKGTEKESVTLDNYKELRCSSNLPDCIRFSIVTDEVEVRTDSMRLEQWLRYHTTKPYISEGKQRELDEQNRFSEILEAQ